MFYIFSKSDISLPLALFGKYFGVPSRNTLSRAPAEVCRRLPASERRSDSRASVPACLSGTSFPAKHQETGRLQCGFCERTFYLKTQLLYHQRAHTGERPFKCKDCDKSFRINSELSKHIRRVHEKERRFQCDICFKRFFYRNELKVHQRKCKK